MSIVGELIVRITGSNVGLTQAIARSEGEMKAFTASQTAHAGAASTAINGIRLAALGVAGGAAVGFGLSVRAAADFQEQMAVINTIARLTPERLTNIGNAIRHLAATSGTALPDMTKGFYDLLSAGVPVNQAMAVLKQSVTLSIGSLSTATQAVDLLTTATNAYGLNAKQSAVATDQFAKAVELGKVTADQIAATFADIAPLAKTAGIGIDEIAATYATLTARGVPAAEAMTQMNRVIVELIKPNTTLIALQNKTHENFAKVAAEKGLVVALQEMRDAADKNHVPFEKLFGRLEGMKFALSTTGPFFSEYQRNLVEMHNATGTAAEQAAERMNTFDRRLAVLGGTVNDVMVRLGSQFLPMLTQFVRQIADIVTGIDQWVAKNPQLASQILPIVAGVAGFVAAATLLAPAIGAVVTVIGLIITPLGIVVGGVLAAAAAFGVFGQGGKTALNNVIAAINGLLPKTGPVREALNTMHDALFRILDVGGKTAAAIFDLVTKTAAFLDKAGVLKGISDGITLAFTLLGVAIQNAASYIRDNFGPVMAGLQIVFQTIQTAVQNAIDTILKLLDLAGQAADAVGKIPVVGDVAKTVGGAAAGGSPGGDILGAIGGALGNIINPTGNLVDAAKAHNIKGFQSGGTVPGYGPQLAVVHGGETVTPAGRGGPQPITLHATIQVGEHKLAEIVERLMFNTSSTYSSGFSDSPVSVR